MNGLITDKTVAALLDMERAVGDLEKALRSELGETSRTLVALTEVVEGWAGEHVYARYANAEKYMERIRVLLGVPFPLTPAGNTSEGQELEAELANHLNTIGAHEDAIDLEKTKATAAAARFLDDIEEESRDDLNDSDEFEVTP